MINGIFSSLLLVLLTSTAGASSFEGADPFSVVEHFKLSNGLEVFLAPHPRVGLTSVQLDVDVGWDAEDKGSWGASHLLEHVLFRDKELKDEMSYLQLIKEAGGSANGSTTQRRTSYFGSIPPEKGVWLVDQIFKMIMNPTITEEYTEREKGTVELERGKPGPITSFLGFYPMDYLLLRYLRSPDFWKTEFGIENQQKFTLSEEQLSTQKLTAKQIKEHYQSYYYPGNMQLFIGGEFDRRTVIQHLKDMWEKVAEQKGKSLPPEPTPVPREIPYYRSLVTTSTPQVSIGVKVWDVSLESDLVIDSYMEYLAHRLMKEIRNKQGQTYTATASTSISRGMGYSLVSFETRGEIFQEKVDQVREYLRKEASAGQLSDEQVKEAIDLYLAEFRLYGKSADSLIDLAQMVRDINSDYGEFRSPQSVLSTMSPARYNSILKDLFRPGRQYEYLVGPPLLFMYDKVLLVALTLILSFLFFKRMVTKDFKHETIRWVRKIRYPPFKIVEAATVVLGLLAYMHVGFLLREVFLFVPWFQQSIFFSQYLMSVIEIFLFVLSVQGAISLLPWKLMVADGYLWVKSISYYSRRISLDQIVSVEAVRPFSLRFFKELWALKWRVFYFSPLFWRKGLLVKCKDGKSSFFGTTQAEKAVVELSSYVAAPGDRLPMTAVA